MKVGTAVDPYMALLNHSCDPKCTWSFEGTELRVTTLKDIENGEELYITYIDDLGDYYGRRRRLLEGWQFLCACLLCKEGPKGLSADKNKLGERVMKLKAEGWPATPAKFDEYTSLPLFCRIQVWY